MRPRLPELRQALVAARAATRPDRGLDASVMLALGWEVRRGPAPRNPADWRVRSPLARAWTRLPELTRAPLAAFALLPPGWVWVVERDRRGAGAAHVDNAEPQSVTVGGTPNPRRLAFHARAATPGLAALSVTLMALLALHERQPAAAEREAA